MPYKESLEEKPVQFEVENRNCPLCLCSNFNVSPLFSKLFPELSNYGQIIEQTENLLLIPDPAPVA